MRNRSRIFYQMGGKNTRKNNLRIYYNKKALKAGYNLTLPRTPNTWPLTFNSCLPTNNHTYILCFLANCLDGPSSSAVNQTFHSALFPFCISLPLWQEAQAYVSPLAFNLSTLPNPEINSQQLLMFSKRLFPSPFCGCASNHIWWKTRRNVLKTIFLYTPLYFPFVLHACKIYLN